MTRLTISLPDDIAGQIKAVAPDGNISAWFTGLARDALLRQEAAAIASFEADHTDEAWDDERFVA